MGSLGCTLCGKPIKTGRHEAFVSFPESKNRVVAFAVTCHPRCTARLQRSWERKGFRLRDAPIEWVVEDIPGSWDYLTSEYLWPQDLMQRLGKVLFGLMK